MINCPAQSCGRTRRNMPPVPFLGWLFGLEPDLQYSCNSLTVCWWDLSPVTVILNCSICCNYSWQWAACCREAAHLQVGSFVESHKLPFHDKIIGSKSQPLRLFVFTIQNQLILLVHFLPKKVNSHIINFYNISVINMLILTIWDRFEADRWRKSYTGLGHSE
jgi:hypothetical protein